LMSHPGEKWGAKKILSGVGKKSKRKGTLVVRRPVQVWKMTHGKRVTKPGPRLET